MKVCTDSCLFGAWIARLIETGRIRAETVLDIGSGTGLLSLMLAQKSGAAITSVEIDENSWQQSKENFEQSPWSSQLKAIHADIKIFDPQHSFDLIISNPPFFENDLISGNENKNIAKHHAALTLQELASWSANHLRKEGNFIVLLPFHRAGYFKKIASENNFFLKEELLVKQTPRHSFFRTILWFGKEPQEMEASHEITIMKQSGDYTPEFRDLVIDYYLEKNFPGT